MNIDDVTVAELVEWVEEMGGEIRYHTNNSEGEVDKVVIVALGQNAADVLDALSDWDIAQQAPLVS